MEGFQQELTTAVIDSSKTNEMALKLRTFYKRAAATVESRTYTQKQPLLAEYKLVFEAFTVQTGSL